MKPNSALITISDNEALIEKMLMEMVFMPRLKALEFSAITMQTPNMKIGYPGQHLASLVTGMIGGKTGARGHDIIDGSEVKSCSRVDQLDSCKVCKERVLRIEKVCPKCGSDNIARMDDSKWLFTIKSQNDLDVLTQAVPRVVLIVSDYPGFSNNDFDTVRIEVFEIWNRTQRNRAFEIYMTDYYERIYFEQKQLYPAKTPAPKNFFPYGYPFYMCNPTKVFSCLIKNVNHDPHIEIKLFVDPATDRATIVSEPIPSMLLNRNEIAQFVANAPTNEIEHLLVGITAAEYNDLKEHGKLDYGVLSKCLPFIDEVCKIYLPLREVGNIRVAKQPYSRKRIP